MKSLFALALLLSAAPASAEGTIDCTDTLQRPIQVLSSTGAVTFLNVNTRHGFCNSTRADDPFFVSGGSDDSSSNSDSDSGAGDGDGSTGGGGEGSPE